MDDLFLKVHDILPIFKIDHKQHHIVYTPGYFILLKVSEVSDLKLLLRDPDSIADRDLRNKISGLVNASKQNVAEWEERKSNPFLPECLTIHVGSECNLNCGYCYSKLHPDITGFPTIELIQEAMNYIVKARVASTKHITLVYHGSGEPTFHWQQLLETYDWISGFAKENNLKISNYIATNGCLKAQQLEWLTKNMDIIGISCDGPPEIQEEQRGISTTDYLSLKESCSKIISEIGQLDIRATITMDTIDKQVEIVQYLIDDLKASRIRIEPVYLLRNGFNPDHSEKFYTGFKEARNYALSRGVMLEYSGVRLEELHSTYCDVSRNTIRLTPDGILRNCFCRFSEDKGFTLGQINKSLLKISEDISETMLKAHEIPEECSKCINIYHCSRACPDFCLFEPDSALNAFKCKLHKLITVDSLKDIADSKIALNGK